MKHWNWRDAVVKPETSLRDTIEVVDSIGCQVALVVEDTGQLVGIVTDGDVRRAILKGEELSIQVKKVMNRNPKTMPASTSREKLLEKMKSEVIHHIPLIENNMLVDLAVLDDLVGAIEFDNQVIIMAGGLGSRLRPLTEDCPKPMLLVGGKPIMETILETFIQQGFSKFFLSVNYKADIIKKHFGSGDDWGVSIEYLHEVTRLGTAGALSLLPEIPQEPVIIMNGDLLTHANIVSMLQFHKQNNSVATMAVREYDFQVPYGVVNISGSSICGIEEKPVHSFYVNAGIYVLSPEAFSLIPDGEYFDMSTFFEKIISENYKTIAYPLREYWLDVGRLEELERAQQDWIKNT